MNQGLIYKAGGVLIKDRKFLLERHGGIDMYITPGGKVENGETAPQALIRELREEFALEVKEKDLQFLGSFESPAVHNPQRNVRIETFLVAQWSGDITPRDGIEGIQWIDSTNAEKFHLSTIARHDILPLLVKMGVID